MTPPPSRAPAVRFIFVTMVLSVLGFGLLIPVLPGLVTQFRGGDISLGSHAYGLLVGVFALLQFVGSPVLGALSDRFGRRRVILVSLAGSSIDYVIMALAPSLGWLFVGRCISGFTAGVLATSNAYVADVTPPERRAQAFGLLGAAFGIGFVLGPLVGGLLGGIDLRLPFWFAAACAALNWFYGLLVLPESLKPELRRPFSWSRANPVGAIRSLGQFPTVRRLADAYFVLMLAQAVLYSTWVLYMSYRYGWTSRQVGLSLGLAGVMAALVQGTLVRRVVAWLGDTRAILAGFCATITALVCYGLAPAGWLIYCIIPIGALGGVSGPALQSYISKRVPPDRQGAVQGVYSGLASLANVPGPLLGAWSFGWAVAHRDTIHLPGIAFFEGAVLVAIGFALVLRTFRQERSGPVSPIAVT